MRWSIRNQILVPFLTLAWLVVGLATIALTRAATNRWEQHTVRQLRQALEVLSEARYPLTENVLRQLKALTGAEFVLTDRLGHPVVGTLPVAPASRLFQQPLDQRGLPATLSDFGRRRLGETDYFVASTIARDGERLRTLVVLYPVPRWQAIQRELLTSTVGIALLSGMVVLVVSWRLAGRLADRIGSLEAQVARLAGGTFETIELGGPRDELQSLAASVNHLADELRRMKQAIAASERQRLLHQWAGGLAHQLRNAITGARLAVQVHQKRCRTDDESLAVALVQIRLMEQQVRGLLALARHESPPREPATIGEVLQEVVTLVRPACEHTGVRFVPATIPARLAQVSVASRDALHSAVLNVVLNAIDAAGPGGTVDLAVRSSEQSLEILIGDDGPGPAAELADRIDEPFVSGKRDGVGLGLAIARHALELLNGRLQWGREARRTVFRLHLPLQPLDPGSPEATAEHGRDAPVKPLGAEARGTGSDDAAAGGSSDGRRPAPSAESTGEMRRRCGGEVAIEAIAGEENQGARRS